MSELVEYIQSQCANQCRREVQQNLSCRPAKAFSRAPFIKDSGISTDILTARLSSYGCEELVKEFKRAESLSFTKDGKINITSEIEENGCVRMCAIRNTQHTYRNSF